MEGLSTLRPDLVTTLLKACQSVKGEALFPLLGRASESRMVPTAQFFKSDLGKGKRVVVPGGKFDSKYQITVPARSSLGAP